MSSFSIHAEKSKPHAICIPFPAQGHINPMFKVAKLLHNKGFHITFVNSEFNHRRLLRSRGPEAIAGLQSFRFETIPDGLPPSDADATQDIAALLESTSKHCLVPFRELVSRINDQSSSSGDVPPVSCIVSDGVMCFTLDVCEELGLPSAVLWTTSACGFLAYVQYRQLVEKSLVPLKDSSCFTNGYLDTVIDWIPGMENIRLKDLPSFVRTTDPDDFVLNFAIKVIEKIKKATGVILNTFDELELDIWNALASTYPNIYSIGPLHLLENQIPEDSELNSMGTNLWKEDHSCLSWLDSKEPNSVVYVNFGSITVMTPEQLIEFAWGLAKSKLPFLWIIRPDLVVGDSAILPPEFISETKERSYWSSWCPQEKVLNHPAIGGFLSHCGWNSAFESICAGVPLICWPFFADQQTNCWYCCTRLCIAMEIDNNVKRDEVAKLVLELMVEEKGKEMKKNAMKLKELAKKAIASGERAGSSYENFEKLVSNVLMSAASN